ncbi:right-handed parallel beta-helix repeat-containing protein [candidate division WOR-3 bacterium]|nr:right-handed parallel beta-helix repeat-containing protein [candidate division WOR-3 bacterium]
MKSIARVFGITTILTLVFPFTGCSGEKEEYDYYLSDYDEDILRPPSGTAEAWVTIIGGDVQGTYYVSPTGDDGNPGTSSEPWASPGYGVSQLSSGDTLVILPRAGYSRPVLAGSKNLGSAIELGATSYLRIENIEITSDNGKDFRDGITGIDGLLEHVVLKDLYIHHVDEFGIDIADVADFQIIDCEITYCGFGAIGGPAGVYGGLRNLVIDGCDLSYSGHYYQGKDGSNRPYDRPDGFGIEESEGPIEIRNTTSTHNYGDGLDSKSSRTWIHECYVANNSCDGVKLWGDSSVVENTLIYGRGDGDDEPTPWAAIVIETAKNNAHIELTNLTVDDYLGENYLMYVQYSDEFRNVPINLRITNCIFSSRGVNARVWLAPKVNPEITYNLFYFPKDEVVLEHGDDTYSSGDVGDLGDGNIYADPGFNTPAWGSDGDYHLKSSSPAIDAGDTTLAPSTDLDGKARPQGKSVDIGCYER